MNPRGPFGLLLLGITGAAVALGLPTDAVGANPATTPCGDATNPQSKTAACAAPNQASFQATYNQLSGQYGTERDVSPSKNVFPAGNKNNAVHVPRYGIPALENAPRAAGAAVGANVGGVTLANTGQYTAVSAIHQTAITGKSKHFHPSKAAQLAKLRASAQNIWAAQETLAHWGAAKACAGKTGPTLLACAEAYERPKTSHPFLSSKPECENFVYNRYYDLERWVDRVGACGEDATCKATITLDGTHGIAGNLLTGSDLDPAHRQAIQQFLDKILTGNAHGVVDCTKYTGADLTTCELIKSSPPVARVRENYCQGPIAGGGSYKSGPGCANFGGPPTTAAYYQATKNPFYDTQMMISPMVMQAFNKDPARLASMQRLVAELARGQNFYAVGKGQKYPDEWAFQKHMLGATSGTSDRTFHDYAKRHEFLEQRAQAFALLFNPLTIPPIRFAIPASTVANILGVAPGTLFNTAATVRSFPSPFDEPPTVSGSEADAAYSLQPYKQLISAIVTQPPSLVDKFAWNNGASPPQMDTSYGYPRLLCSLPDKMMPAYATRLETAPAGPETMPVALPMTPINGPPVDGSNPTPNRNPYCSAAGPGTGCLYSDVGTAACNYINAVLDEWARKDAPGVLASPGDKPQPSGCFANDPACDWSPQEFVAGMEDMVHAQIRNVEYPTQERDYKFCKEWKDSVSGQMAKSNDNTEENLLAAMKAKLQGAFNEISHLPPLDRGPKADQVPWTHGAWKQSHPEQYAQNSFATFGENRSNAENWGNDTFGVGYSYDAGWEMPVEWQPSTTKDNYEVCAFGAGAHGGFDAYAYAFGSDKFDILDADLAAGFNDWEDVPVPGVPSQSQLDSDMHRINGAFDLNFAVAGDDLYDKDYAMPSGGITVPAAQGSNSWTLFDIPFQVAFVTVNMSVGIGYQYEIDASVTPTNQADVCRVGKLPTPKGWPALTQRPRISLSTGLNAQGELDGIVDASASLAGLVGIGVRCNIELLGIGVPASMTATIDPSAQAPAKSFYVNSALNMNLSSLSGSLEVYAEALFFTIFDVTIASWDGLSATVPLFNEKQGAQLGDLDPLGKHGLQNPEKALQGL